MAMFDYQGVYCPWNCWIVQAYPDLSCMMGCSLGGPHQPAIVHWQSHPPRFCWRRVWSREGMSIDYTWLYCNRFDSCSFTEIGMTTYDYMQSRCPVLTYHPHLTWYSNMKKKPAICLNKMINCSSHHLTSSYIQSICNPSQPYLVGGWVTPLKNMSSSIPFIYGKTKLMFQTTNQISSWSFSSSLFPATSNFGSRCRQDSR